MRLNQADVWALWNRIQKFTHSFCTAPPPAAHGRGFMITCLEWTAQCNRGRQARQRRFIGSAPNNLFQDFCNTTCYWLRRRKVREKLREIAAAPRWFPLTCSPLVGTLYESCSVYLFLFLSLSLSFPLSVSLGCGSSSPCLIWGEQRMRPNFSFLFFTCGASLFLIWICLLDCLLDCPRKRRCRAGLFVPLCSWSSLCLMNWEVFGSRWLLANYCAVITIKC